MTFSRAMGFAATCAFAAAVSIGPVRSRADDSLYERDVKPMLLEKCSSCHGPLKQEASLRLDAAALIREGGDSGSAAAPGDVEGSLLLARVSAPDAIERMPPEGEGEPLTDEQRTFLAAWIASGMPAPPDEKPLTDPSDHWAYQPPEPFPAADAADEAAGENSIDRLVDAKLDAAGIEPFPEADRATLLRRLTFDLIGLPPTVEELRAFLADDAPDAFERTVDRLLDDPRYGERWGRHWMDVWRYSDWDGYKDELRTSQRHIWRWRDWIVRSLNEDKPYERMIVEMLAADEVAPRDPDALAATGFLARNYHNSNRNIWLDATVEHSAKAFVGMTINCAKCHDHKFDPIAQTDYYAWRAVFEPHRVRTERVPGQLDVMQDGLPRVYDAELETPTYLYVRGDEKHPDEENPLAPGVPDVLPGELAIQPVDLPPIAYFPALSERVERESIAQAEGAVDAARKALADAKSKAEALKSEPAPAGDGASEGKPEGTTDEDGPAKDDAVTQDAAAQESAAKLRDAENAVQSSELSLAVAERSLASLASRWAADRAKHEDPDAADEANIADLSNAASLAERQHRLAEAERDLFTKRIASEAAEASAEADEKKRAGAIDKAAKELAAAQKKRDEAAENVEAESAEYASVGELYPKVSSGRRLALARWIVASDNPLTARVAVNHVWMRHFGEPFVADASDFGLRAPRPVQQDVLDALAVELVESGWSLKALHRRIVTSRAWRRASSASPERVAANASVDSENALLWRYEPRRLEAEAIRDAALYVAGTLDSTMGGPDLDFMAGESVYRRSLYFRHANEKRMQMLTLFDSPSPEDCYRRAESVVPQQALAIANGELSRSMSRTLAVRLSQEIGAEGTDDAFVSLAFESTLSRHPTEAELAASLKFLAAQRERLASPGSLTAIGGTATPKVAASADPALRARESLVHVLFEHNDFVTIR